MGLKTNWVRECGLASPGSKYYALVRTHVNTVKDPLGSVKCCQFLDKWATIGLQTTFHSQSVDYNVRYLIQLSVLVNRSITHWYIHSRISWLSFDAHVLNPVGVTLRGLRRQTRRVQRGSKEPRASEYTDAPEMNLAADCCNWQAAAGNGTRSLWRSWDATQSSVFQRERTEQVAALALDQYSNGIYTHDPHFTCRRSENPR
jgi:hypothetical protein